MNVRAVGIWGLAIVTAVLGAPAPAQPPARRDPAPGPSREMDPNVIGTRYAQSEKEIVPPEEREKLGLDDASWTKRYGKVHPDVYAALEKAEKVREPWLDPVGFAGTVYVQVQLKQEQKGKTDSAENKAAIKQLERNVLGQVTAAQFYVVYPFQSAPAILGYASRAALEKLGSDADVVAIRLDDKAFPRHSAPVTKADLPAGKSGEPSTGPAQGRTRESGGKVETDVYRALAACERVFVIVNLKDTRTHEPLTKERDEENRNIQDWVLSALTAEEFWLTSRAPYPTVDGLVNAQGLSKLANDPAVEGVGLSAPRSRIPEDVKKAP